MGEQRTLAGEAWARTKEATWREQFLAKMNAVIPWVTLLARVASHYPKTGQRGRPPMLLERLLRI
jgi:hypothetical protein